MIPGLADTIAEEEESQLNSLTSSIGITEIEGRSPKRWWYMPLGPWMYWHLNIRLSIYLCTVETASRLRYSLASAIQGNLSWRRPHHLTHLLEGDEHHSGEKDVVWHHSHPFQGQSNQTDAGRRTMIADNRVSRKQIALLARTCRLDLMPCLGQNGWTSEKLQDTINRNKQLLWKKKEEAAVKQKESVVRKQKEEEALKQNEFIYLKQKKEVALKQREEADVKQ